MHPPLPERLKHDAIVETAFELQFELDTTSIPELMFGKLASHASWTGFHQKRLPAADIPRQIKLMDPNLRYQPDIELEDPGGAFSVRLGIQSVAISRRAPYPGWAVYRQQVNDLIDNLFDAIPNVKVTRVGLRYINALTDDLHFIRSVSDLELDVRAAGKKILDNLNLNYEFSADHLHTVMVRIANRRFVEGQIPVKTSALVDVDVYTPTEYISVDREEIRHWTVTAHDVEKVAFFSLLPNEIVEKLRA